MNHWNYRIFKREYPNAIGPTTLYELHEVFYNEDHKIQLWTENPVAGPAESVEELLGELRLKARDAWRCREDILDYAMEREADFDDSLELEEGADAQADKSAS